MLFRLYLYDESGVGVPCLFQRAYLPPGFCFLLFLKMRLGLFAKIIVGMGLLSLLEVTDQLCGVLLQQDLVGKTKRKIFWWVYHHGTGAACRSRARCEAVPDTFSKAHNWAFKFAFWSEAFFKWLLLVVLADHCIKNHIPCIWNLRRKHLCIWWCYKLPISRWTVNPSLAMSVVWGEIQI